MKKNIAAVLCLVLVLSLAGCGAKKAEQNASTFWATVIEVEEKSMIVKPEDGSPELASADKISVPLEVTDPSTNPKVGDRVEITYNGDIMETYPAMLGKVISIRVITPVENATADRSN